MFSVDAAEEFSPGNNQAKYVEDFGIIHFDETNCCGYQARAASLDHDSIRKADSDHRPLWMRFKTNADHYDDTW